MLVNPTGKEKKWRGVDWCVELNNLFTKVRKSCTAALRLLMLYASGQEWWKGVQSDRGANPPRVNTCPDLPKHTGNHTKEFPTHPSHNTAR